MPDPANKEKPSWARVPSIKSEEVPVEKGKPYLVAAWARAARPDTPVEIGVQAYRAGIYHWAETRTVAVGTEWSRLELLVRVPAGGHPEMKSFYIRFRLPGEEGQAWIDDGEMREVALDDEWKAWQALGMDRHSLVADPLFTAPEKDDYRLKPGSPAWKLGFQPIPVERIGCYRDPLRASWPLARE